MNDEQGNAVGIPPQGYPTLLLVPVFFIKDADRRWIKKNLSGMLKTYPVFFQIIPGLVRVPIKIILQRNLPSGFQYTSFMKGCKPLGPK